MGRAGAGFRDISGIQNLILHLKIKIVQILHLYLKRQQKNPTHNHF